jgi:hypothetical protein
MESSAHHYYQSGFSSIRTDNTPCAHNQGAFVLQFVVVKKKNCMMDECYKKHNAAKK